MERFIERGSSYHLRNATLSIYETNCACKDIKFHFSNYVLTLMINGHKRIKSNNFKLDFLPDTLFIPEKEQTIDVSIPNATIKNPTKCLVLEIQPDFIKNYYEEILSLKSDTELLYKNAFELAPNYFISNNRMLVNAFKKLYYNYFEDRSAIKPIVEDLYLKEILLRIFQTKGLYLMIENFKDCVQNADIRKVTSYISNNLEGDLSVKNLSTIAGLGHTSFYNKFKYYTGYSPNEYVLFQRIRHAKILIRKSQYSLKEVAYKCGFNSYEYFSSRFKKAEHIKPSEFRIRVLKNIDKK